jgi:hypothetical protein
MRTAWKTTITAPAAWRALLGPKTNQGATSSAAWLKRTPSLELPPRQEMKPPAERVRDRLGLEVIEERREVAPAGVAPDLDQAGPEHDPEDEPPEEPDDGDRGLPAGNGRASRSGQRKMARKPVSSSWNSQPYPYQSCPTWTKER